MRRVLLGVWLVWAATFVGSAQPGFEWNLPRGFPSPRVPADNPMTSAKVDLGRHLFYDTRLSANQQQSCASCHDQTRAFTDGRERAVGSTGEVHPRNSMSLVNVAYAGALTWGNPTLRRLEDQALVPMFGDHPIELGLSRPGTQLLERLETDGRYRSMFAAAFPETPKPFSIDNVTKALASFERSIISARSPYDRYHTSRDNDAISPAARRGEVLFFSQPFSCFRCHNGFMMAGATDFDGRQATAEGGIEFHNTGLYNLPGLLSYPAPNTGIYETTKRPEDVGRFKAPTLRNIAVTGPYMHDGSIATLDGVLDHYAAGGRTIGDGPYRGVGHDNPNKSPSVRGFALTAEQRADFLAFLSSLTDNELLRDPRFSNPWIAH
ncbi:MAG TPA: di-heme enzyme [Vicinamibacterales bacterium]|nr:di-heme enzyme [Vicinamibacterales bacterium]